MSLRLSYLFLILSLIVTACGGGDSGDPSNAGTSTDVCSTGTYTYAVLNDGVAGDEIYKVNGNGACTQMLNDFSPNGGGSGISESSLWGLNNGVVVFIANDGINNKQLWRADSNGVARILNIDLSYVFFNSSAAIYNEQGAKNGAIVLNNRLYFVISIGNEHQLWVTDGYDSGTVLLHTSNRIEKLITFGDRIYFSSGANTAATLWSTNGSASGTSEFLSVIVDSITVMGDSLYHFSGSTLYRTSGTPLTTVTVGSVANGTVSKIHKVNNLLLFYSFTSNGTELFSTNGTAAPLAIADISLDVPHVVSMSGMARNSTNKFFIRVTNSSTREETLWVTDGLSQNTVNLNLTNSIGTRGARKFTELNNRVYFFAKSGTLGDELYNLQGNTISMIDIDINSLSNPEDLIAYNGNLYFSASDSLFGQQLWRYNGTQAERLSTNFDGQNGYSVRDFTLYNNEIYFVGLDTSGHELWKINDQADSLSRITDINPFGSSLRRNYKELTIIDNQIYFVATDAERGEELWRSGGTSETTTIIGDINQTNIGMWGASLFSQSGNSYFFISESTGSGIWRVDEDGLTLISRIPGNGYINHITQHGPFTYFVLDHSNAVNGIWRTDGTEAGTSFVLDFDSINPASSTIVSGMVSYQGELYFMSNWSGTGYGLWRLNLDNSQAEVVSVVNPSDRTFIYDSSLQVHLNKMFFVANDGVNGSEAWVSEGTDATTEMLFDANTTGNGSPILLAEMSGRMYFSAINSAGMRDLWSSDGTVTQSVIVSTSFNPYSAKVLGDSLLIFGEERADYSSVVYSYNGSQMNMLSALPYTPNDIVSYKNQIYFVTGDPQNSGTHDALWVTGAEAGSTRIVKSIQSSFEGQYEDPMEDLVVAGELMYFTHFDDVNGRELWVSDGTENGTTVLGDVNPGLGEGLGSNPLNMYKE